MFGKEKELLEIIEKMRKFILLISILFLSFNIQAQNTEKVWRINVLNPGVELEMPTGKFSTIAANIGVGYDGGYPDLTYGGSGFTYIIAPFLDLQQKWFYNLKKRTSEDKTTEHNSGNFLSFRFKAKGNSIAENVERTSDFDFAFGPTLGIQRKYGKSFHLLVDIGPQYYFDTEGNGNIYPIMLQLNLGFDL
jgi:hypothetical protein